MASSPSEAIRVHQIFDDEEAVLIERVLDSVTRMAPSDAAVLRRLMDTLSGLSEVLARSQRLHKPTKLANVASDERTMTEYLCQIDGLAGDLALPVRASLSRSFLLAKIDFFRACIKVTSVQAAENKHLGALCHELREEMAQSIYTQLAEELLLALLRHADVNLHTKREAASQLIAVWDNAKLEIDDFCPLLESAWHARNRVTSGLGAMLGTTEYFRLVSEDCAPQFLDFFARDDLSEAEGQAFEEFLFNMTYEELCTLRETMRKDGRDAVTAGWASNVLDRALDELDPSGEVDPMALYQSYFRRQLAADYRTIAGTPGPQHTAESYLMIVVLDQQ